MRFAALLTVVVAASLPARAALVPEEFLLTNYQLRTGPFQVNTAATLIGLHAGATVYDFALWRVALSYAGSVNKPFSREQPLDESHMLSARLATRSGRIAAGMALGSDISVLDYSLSEKRYGAPEPGIYPVPSYLRETDVRTEETRLRYGGTMNLLMGTNDHFAELALAGGLLRHEGYFFSQENIDNYYVRFEIRDFATEPLSGGYALGALLVKRLGNRFCRLDAFVGARYSCESDSQFVAPPTQTVPVDPWGRRITVAYGAHSDVRRERYAWVGVRPSDPFSPWGTNLLYHGRHFHGVAVSEFMVQAGGEDVRSSDLAHTISNFDQHTDSRAWVVRTRSRLVSGRLAPEVFFARWLSVAIPVTAAMTSTTDQDVVGGYYRPESTVTWSRSNVMVEGMLHTYLTLWPHTWLKVSVRTGELVFGRSDLIAGTAVDLPSYRAYNAGISVELFGVN